MSKKNETGYLSAKESRRISRENRRITDQLEKRHKRKNVPESEYLTQMKDPNNALEIENLHTYFFSDVASPSTSPSARPWAWWASPAAVSPLPASPSCSCCSGRRARSWTAKFV